jgi:hypothetical protein
VTSLAPHTPRIHCLVSDRDDHSLLPALAETGIDGFQVRAKDLGGRALAELTRAVLAAVPPYAARVLVDDGPTSRSRPARTECTWARTTSRSPTSAASPPG